jgi:hypothetical protein
MTAPIDVYETEYTRVRPGRGSYWSLALLAAGCAMALGAASLRHTGSVAFPIDDAYIYSNYVLNASSGDFFRYNLGETSGGMTSLGWYIICTLSYWILLPLHNLFAWLAPSEVQADVVLARQVGHLYAAAYLPGLVFHALTAIGVFRLGQLTLATTEKAPAMRNIVAWVLGAVAAASLGLAWGTMSGLEIPLSSAVVVWALVLLITDARSGEMRGSLLLAAALPFGRPELLIVGLAGLLWLVIRALFGPHPTGGPGASRGRAGLYFVALVVGSGMAAGAYYLGWGRPLPGSFYAKVGELRLSERFFAAAEELWIAGRVAPFIGTGLALLGGLVDWIAPSRTQPNRYVRDETSSSALLLLIVLVGYIAGLMLTTPWFGQEDRYLLPVQSVGLVLVGMLVWRFLILLPAEQLAVSRGIAVSAGLALVILGVGFNYVWATRNYAVQVRNMRDAHILPALWLAQNTPQSVIVAAEPIGAVRTFSGRRTIDLVGLTSPLTLGTYGDWPAAWEALDRADAAYLLFYPNWFDNREAPPWAVEVQRFEVPDNRIAGDNVIAIYELAWDRY